MFNLGKLTTDLLNTIDNAAKETLEEPKESATALRQKKKSNVTPPSGETDISSRGFDTSKPISNFNDESETVHNINERIRSSSSSGVALSDLEPDDDRNSDLKYIIKNKNKEIEKLNSECLELEESCNSLRSEVKDAWDSYRVSQEKAAARESELLEEIRALQKAKAIDKQQWQAQMIQLNEEAAEALKKVKLIEIERDEAIKKMNAALEASLTWEDRETELLAEIDELKSGTLQGVQSLREELEREREINRNLRSEHQSILRQNEQRLHELETQSATSMRALTEKEHELMSIRAVLGQAGGPKDFNQLVRELDSAKTDIDNLNKQIDEQKDICQKLERRTRQAEAELKANQLRWEDERNRFHELLTLSDARIIELQDKLKQLEILNKDIPSNEDSNAGSTNNKMAQLMEQIQSLSKQLLKKQEQAMEQQAEKSVLKSRINDLLTRCTQAEQELSRLRDLEDGQEDNDDDTENIPSDYVSRDDNNNDSISLYVVGGGGGKVGLTHRTAANTPIQTPIHTPVKHRGSSRRYRSGQVIAELEQLGVRASPAVAKAVDFLDTCTLLTGRFLRNHSLLRILFVFYLLVLHLWVIFVLGMHAHSIDLDKSDIQNMGLARAGPRTFVTNKLTPITPVAT